MRITQSMLSDRSLYNLQQNMVDLNKIHNQLSSGQKISKPSDDSLAFTQSLNLRSIIRQQRVFQSNIESVRANLEHSETSLNSLTELLQTIRTKAIQGGNDFDPAARLTLSHEVREMYEQILDIANSNYNGQFIFGGSQTKQTPFTLENGVVTYQGDTFERQISIATTTKLTSNIHGQQAFLHTPNQITASVAVQDTSAPLAEQLRLAHPDFPNLPNIPNPLPNAQVERSPNPQNHISSEPNNYAYFSIYGTEIRVDLSVDSLEDVQNRINAKVSNVEASINQLNQLVITSKRADALNLQDGPKNIGYPAAVPQQTNFLSAIGMHRTIENQRALNHGFPALDPLTDPNASPTQRSAFALNQDAFLFAQTNTGPNSTSAIPFADNIAISNIDATGKEVLLNNTDPDFINQLEAIRITIDNEIIDINLRELSQGRDFDGIPGNEDDIPGSRLEAMLELINNHPQLKGKATAFINANKTGIGISATGSTDEFHIESIRKLFGRDITTRVTIQPVTGATTYSRISELNYATELADLPGALVDPTVGAPGDPVSGSLGIRQPEPPPSGQPPATNQGLIIISNNKQTATVDLREAKTIGDVIQAINDSKVGVKAEINTSKTGINLTSIIGNNEEIRVVDFGDSTIAKDLGLFNPPANRALSSNPGLTTTNTIAAELPGMGNDGSFEIEIRDNAGDTIETFQIEVSASDTLEDIITRIDAIDGAAGPGKGLITANFADLNPPAGPTLNIVNNYNGHTIFIDTTKDTTGTSTADRFTELTGLNGYTIVTEAEANTLEPYSSTQDTAAILGIKGKGTVNEIEEHNVFQTVRNLELALRNDDTEGIQQALTAIDIDLDHVLNTRTSLGARINRLDATLSRLQTGEDYLRQDLSKIEDIDLAEAISELNLKQNAFNAALQASSRIIQQTLLNFLN